MADKKSILIYTEFREDIEDLTDKQAGILLKSLLRYQDGIELPAMDKVVKAVFNPLRRSIERNNEKYERRCERNKENARKRWEQKQCQDMQSHANASSRTNSHSDSDSDSDSDKDSDRERERDIPYGIIGEAPTPNDQQLQMIVHEWNQSPNTNDIRDILPMTKRWNELRICMGIYGFDGVMDAIHKLTDSKWIANRGHKANFDSFMNSNAIQKVLEGNYDDDYQAETGAWRSNGDGLEWDC